MDESDVKKSSKENKRINKLQKLPRTDDLLSGSSDNCKPCIKGSKTRPAWKSFFNLFTKTSVDKMSTISESVIPKQIPDLPKDVYLSDINDEFALAICLPENVTGADVKVDIELEAIKKIDNSSSNFGLKLLKATLSKTTFCGNIKCPANITIDNISKMPLYFVSSAVITHSNGYKTQKIETIIKPLKDNLPLTMDKEIMVSDIKLIIHLQNLKKIKRSQILKHCKFLNYTFIQNERKILKPSLHNIKTEEIIEEIAESNKTYNEESKNIVKEILNHVVTKVQAQDISTQYSKLVTSVSKEIDVQKSLLIKNSEMDTVNTDDEESTALSKICEKDEIDSIIDAALKTSYDTLYPRSSTSFTAKESALTDTESSIFYLKVPQNTPDMLYTPRYIIKYDSLLSLPDKKLYQMDGKRSLNYETTKHVNHISLSNASPKQNNYKLNEEIKADIDKTLELLERAKFKLLGYLDMSFESTERFNDFEYKTCSQNTNPRSKPNDHSAAHERNDLHQFFLEDSKNSETPNLISFSNENIARINTIQNIYNTTFAESPLQLTTAQIDQENIWKNRYSGDNHENNELAYSIVENDINLMIMDLLKESNTVKELAISNMGDDTIRDVKYILELLLTRTEESIDIKPLAGELQAPPNIFITEPTCTNYCILDQNIGGDAAVALMDQPNLFDSPVISVKNLTNLYCKSNYVSEESLVQRLEKGCSFLTEIYNEICVNEIFYIDNIVTKSETVAEVDDSINCLTQSTSIQSMEMVNVCPASIVHETVSKCLEDTPTLPQPIVLGKNIEHPDFSASLSNIKYEFVSMQELNNREEMDYIEENLKHNEKMDSEEESILKRNKKPFVRRSAESITPIATDSETSIELNTSEQFQIKQ